MAAVRKDRQQKVRKLGRETMNDRQRHGREVSHANPRRGRRHIEQEKQDHGPSQHKAPAGRFRISRLLVFRSRIFRTNVVAKIATCNYNRQRHRDTRCTGGDQGTLPVEAEGKGGHYQRRAGIADRTTEGVDGKSTAMMTFADAG